MWFLVSDVVDDMHHQHPYILYVLVDVAFGLHFQLEQNISLNAFSLDWVKLMDDWLVDISVIQSTSYTLGFPPKRGPAGRRRRKQSIASEVTADICDDKSFDWWRGGKLSTHVFQKAILPASMVRKAARQGIFVLYEIKKSNLLSL